MAMWAFFRSFYAKNPSGDTVRAYHWPEKEMEMEEEDIERELLSYFVPDARKYAIVIKGETVIAASLPMCSMCDELAVLCPCGIDDIVKNIAYIGYQVERIKQWQGTNNTPKP